jgi:hypothetical protein
MSYVQTTLVSLAGHVGIGVEGSNATVPGDDKWHGNSANDLTLPPMDRYGPTSRFFDVFWRGTNSCDWKASPEVPWIKLSQNTGTVGPKGADVKVLVSIDWKSIPSDAKSKTYYINVTTPCRSYDKYAYREPRVLLPVNLRTVPDSFKKGFVESDGVVSIEGPHYQAVVPGSSTTGNLTYHNFKNYGRTMGGVGLYPPETEKLAIGQGPAIEYSLYLFSNTVANVSLYLSPSHNYLGDGNPLEYAIALFPVGSEPEPKTVAFVGRTQGGSMPAGWGGAVADAVWGVRGNYSTSGFRVSKEGAYTLRIWALLPSIIVQKVVINLGGLRESYLGPPESFLFGRDEIGAYSQTSFLTGPGVLGGVGGQAESEE